MSTPESFQAHLEWLYGKGGVYGGDGHQRCRCDHIWTTSREGDTWARKTTHPDCYFHGTAAQKHQDECLRRYRKTGDWGEFHVQRNDGDPS